VPGILEKMLRARGTLLASQDMNAMAQGRELFAAPPWVVGVLGAGIVLSGAAYFLWRVRGARRATSGSASVRPAAPKIR
jgi:hypothetical protein